MKELVKLNERPSSDGKSFKYILRYTDEGGKRRWDTLGHSDRRKAEKQRTDKEKELRMGYVEPDSMMLRDFLKDSLAKTGDQIRESTRKDYKSAMSDLIKTIGNIDFQSVQQTHGELFRQTCLDHGNSPATVTKKIRELKRLFQLAVERRQLDENPFRFIKSPKAPKPKIRIYSPEECEHIIRAASDFQDESVLEWDIIITLALTTAMRKSELLNLVWRDVDFGEMVIEVSPKQNTAETWEWKIKDTDRRFVPLIEDVGQLLINLQNRMPTGYPYVFVPPERYNFIQQKRRSQGRWTLINAKDNVHNNFSRDFAKILCRAHVSKGTFHDIRKTAITNWFRQGLSEYDVMKLAGHSSFETTHRFYLAVADDLIERARWATAHKVSRELMEKSTQRGCEVTKCLSKKLVHFGATGNFLIYGENRQAASG